MAKRKSTKGQRSTKHTCKTKDQVTRTPLKTWGELWCSRRVSSSCSTSGTRHVNLVTNPVISREWGKDREVFTTSGTYLWSLRSVELVGQELLTLQSTRAHLSFFSVVPVAQSLVICVEFCWLLFVLLFWALYCLSFFDLQILINPLVSSNQLSTR
jgi:hypothetical protein